jgi:hypothetical protein
MNKLRKLFGVAFTTLVLFLYAPQGVAAASVGLCDFIGPICDALGITSSENAGSAAIDFVKSRGELILSLVFIGIILLSVVIIIQAGVKYIQSQGDEGKIAESTKAIKSVFIGIGVLIVGIAGLILVLVFFNATGFLKTDEADETTLQGCVSKCVSAGGSDGDCYNSCFTGQYK